MIRILSIYNHEDEFGLDTDFSLNPPGGWGSVHKEVETLWSTPAREFFSEKSPGERDL